MTSDSEDVVTALIARDDLRLDALAAGDAVVLESLLDDDFVYIHSSGVEEAKDSFVESIASGRTGYHGVDLTRHAAWVFGDTATIRGRVVLDLEIGGARRVLDLAFLAVWVSPDGGWMLREWASIPVKRTGSGTG
ncbi:nuclear transport factor 2 family protein [Microbacterium sp. LWH7-1.2]|uniref:nuclear transport factor 2 family protein n=1 Tax=Microbacterium sp. LWH7-1.2 TaxID=3135257 RepID=UPI0031395616